MYFTAVDHIPTRQKTKGRIWAERVIDAFSTSDEKKAMVFLDAEMEVENPSYACVMLRNVIEREGLKDKIKVMQRCGEVYIEKAGVKDE